MSTTDSNRRNRLIYGVLPVWAVMTLVLAGSSVVATIPVGNGPIGIRVGVNATTNRVYVPNFFSNTVSIIDGDTDTVSSTVAVGREPHSTAVNPLTNRIYVANYASGTVSVIDGNTSTVTATINVVTTPRGIDVNEVTNRIYTANRDNNYVSVIDGGTNLVIATVPVGSFSAGVAVNTATNRIYVANAGGNTVSVIDGNTNTNIRSIVVGSSPSGVDADAALNRIYVTNGVSATLSVIDGVSDTVIATVPVGGGPVGVDVNAPIGRIYVANFNDDTVSVIDAASHAVVETIAVGDGAYGVGMSVNAMTSRVYVTNYLANTVSVIAAPWTFTFTDEPLSSTVTPVKAVHFTELLNAINTLRARHALSDVSFADSPLSPGTTQIRATHITQLRAALDAVYDALGRARPGYTDATITAGVTPIKLVHVNELRAAARAAGMFILTVGRSGAGSGTVTSVPAGITCGTDCTESFLPSTSVTLTPSPSSGSYFANWTGACSGNGTCTVPMTANTVVGATFSTAETFDVHPRLYHMGVGGGCNGGVLGVQFTVNAPAGVNWNVGWTGSDLPGPGQTHVGSLNQSSGTGPGSVIFTVTVASQSPSSGYSCAQFNNYFFADNFFFRFYDSNGIKTNEITTRAEWTYRLVW